jgi:hypothetical protein
VWLIIKHETCCLEGQLNPKLINTFVSSCDRDSRISFVVLIFCIKLADFRLEKINSKLAGFRLEDADSKLLCVLQMNLMNKWVKQVWYKSSDILVVSFSTLAKEDVAYLWQPIARVICVMKWIWCLYITRVRSSTHNLLLISGVSKSPPVSKGALLHEASA